MESEAFGTILEHFSPARLFIAAVLLSGTWVFVHLLRLLANTLAERFSRHRLLISSLYPVLRLFIWVAAVAFVIFAVFRPPLNTLLTISASLGLAVGLGAQDLIKNVIAGILVLFDRPFRVGDMIQVGEHYGEVTNIGLRSIRLQTFGDSTVTLPNSAVLGQAVSNSNSGALDEMVVVDVHLPSDADLSRVKVLAREAAVCSPYVFLRKPVSVTVEDGFDRTPFTRVKIKAYVLDIRYEPLLASDITERFKHTCAERGILPGRLALPQMSGKIDSTA